MNVEIIFFVLVFAWKTEIAVRFVHKKIAYVHIPAVFHIRRRPPKTLSRLEDCSMTSTDSA